MEGQIQAQLELRKRCDELGASKFGWLERLKRAADSGDRQAEQDIVQWAYEDFRDGVLPSELEEAAARRDIVRRYAEDLLRSGDCGALSALQWSVTEPLQLFRYQIAYVNYSKQLAFSRGVASSDFTQANDYLAQQRASFTAPEQSWADASATLLTSGCEN